MIRIEIFEDTPPTNYWLYLYVNDKLVASDFYDSIYWLLGDTEMKHIIEEEVLKCFATKS